jgi:cell division protein YceG involved in septum cleavage
MLIKDKSLGKYLINATSGSFDVGIMKTDKEGKEFFAPDTYHTNMENAIKRVIRNLMEEHQETVTLEEWLTMYQSVNEKIQKSLKILS